MREPGVPRVRAVLGEALRMAASQPVVSSVTALLVAASSGVILATVGQTAAAEQQILATIDQAGTRSVVLVDVEGRAAISPQAVDRIAALSRVEWVIGLGQARDATNAHIPGGSPVAVRALYGVLPCAPYAVHSPWERRPGTVLAGSDALRTLGMSLPVGGLQTGVGDLAVVGWLTATDPLAFLNRSLLAVPDPEVEDPVLRAVHILVERPDDVALVAEAARAVVGAEDPTSLAVETSEAFALLRAAVSGELGRYGRQLVTFVLGAMLVLVGLNVYGSVSGRRRDFGRRRALGATRSTLVGLVVLQTVAVAMIGAAVGASVGSWVAWRLSGAWPQAGFAVGVGILSVLSTALAAVPPAVTAAYRDPVRILRVP